MQGVTLGLGYHRAEPGLSVVRVAHADLRELPGVGFNKRVVVLLGHEVLFRAPHQYLRQGNFAIGREWNVLGHQNPMPTEGAEVGYNHIPLWLGMVIAAYEYGTEPFGDCRFLKRVQPRG